MGEATAAGAGRVATEGPPTPLPAPFPVGPPLSPQPDNAPSQELGACASSLGLWTVFGGQGLAFILVPVEKS